MSIMNMTIAKEEIFGPVVSIIPFSTEEEAIKISNDTDYGLTNYIQTMTKKKQIELRDNLDLVVRN